MKKLITLLSALTLFTLIGGAVASTTSVASAKTVHHKKKKVVKHKKVTKKRRIVKKHKKVTKKKVVNKRKVVKKKVVKKTAPKKKSVAKKQTKTDPMINTSNKQAVPLISYNYESASIDGLDISNVKNIVSTEKNLPTKISNPLNKNGTWNMQNQTIYYYSNSKYDKSEKINPKKLTRKQLIELNQYANQLLNSYRKEIKNTGKVITTNTDIDATIKMINERTKHDVDVWNDKYDSLAVPYPEKTAISTQVAGYDDPRLRNTNNDVTTMLQLKTSLYNVINNELNLSGYNRGEILTGDKSNTIHSCVGVQYRSQTLRKKDPNKLLTFIITTTPL